MSTKETLKKLIESMPDEQLQEVLNFASLLSEQQDHVAWRAFGQAQLARAYGPDEPDYTLDDIKPELNS